MNWFVLDYVLTHVEPRFLVATAFAVGLWLGCVTAATVVIVGFAVGGRL